LEIESKTLTVEITKVSKKEGKIDIIKTNFESKPKTSILDLLYIPDKRYEILLTSTNDGFVRGWKYTNNGWVLAS